MHVIALGTGQKTRVFIKTGRKHQGSPLSLHAGMSENWKPTVVHSDDHPILEDVGLLPAFLPPALESEGAHP